MSKLDRNFRAAMSFALALIIASVAALNSVAASNASREAPRESSDGRLAPSVVNALMGRVTGTGHFTIDGDQAQPGATVLSGSSVATGSDGDVTIDLGSLGQIALRPETSIRLTLSQNEVEVSLERAGSILQLVPAGVVGRLTVQGGNTRLGVSRGEAEVKLPGSARTIQAGDIMALDQRSQVITKGDTIITAEGNTTKAQAPAPSQAGMDTAGLIGVIALAGTATAITLAVMSGRNHSNTPIPPRPSGVTP
ncbi:MAG TPA: hypothetical protein VF762_24825 [Blastocatellia bacterium]|jgi:hypothetical protein